ncbi:hypothetical protein GLOIN_2v1782174 [Rhizophagus clarus]|uniref:WIF domain-containing protein n=1 Tax=Rhizophagus clarus TaxID=94130 RepID=A0A8H3KX79_9GLOM|nr:hypothetical protein GLOIN_2v1782174 [Rhizophagus clarus]
MLMMFLIMIFDFINYIQENNNAGWVGKDVAESLGREFIIRVKKQFELEYWIPLEISLINLNNPTKRYVYLSGFEKAFPFKVGHYSFNSGNNAFNVTWVWKIDMCLSKSTIMNKSRKVISGPKELVP